MIDENFGKALQQLIDENKIVIDRPKGSRHPRFSDLTYPLDYGYLDGTVSGDGKGIDIWKGGSKDQLTAVIAVCDLLKKDTEIKLLIDCSDEDIEKILNHHRNGSMTATVVGKL